MSTNYDAQLERAIRDIYYNFYERQDKRLMYIDAETNSPVCRNPINDDESLYYKLSSDRLIRVHKITRDTLDSIVNLMINLAIRQDVEYVVYVVNHGCITPSFSCMYRVAYLPPIFQFFKRLLKPWYFSVNILDILRSADPLTQISLYYALLNRTNALKSTYICWDIITIVPFGQDQTSLFHGRTGIVAYCTPLVDFVLHQVKLDDFNKMMEQLEWKAYGKLADNKELDELWQKDPAKACDINLIKSIIHDEIEEAEKLMKQYNIIRAAIPLD